MKACGIIAEYNPFHLGHRYQLQEARRYSQADVVVVAMSGNFVQRGEPAIENKWERAEQALLHGADVVLEIPTLGCCQASDYFAQAGISILQAAHCEGLSFGVEEADSDLLWQALAEWQKLSPFKEGGENLSFAHRLSQEVKLQIGEASALYQILQHPNQQLAFSYLKAIAASKEKMALYPVSRMGSAHQEIQLNETGFSSGTAIRSALLNTNRAFVIKEQLPYTINDDRSYHNHWEHYWEFLSYQIQRSSIEDLQRIYQMEEGIEYRLKKYQPQAMNFHHFMTLMKNKRWTWARLQRLCLAILLGIKKEEAPLRTIEGVAVLGFTSTGQTYLKTLKNSPVPFLTNYAHPSLKRQQQLDAVYDMRNPSNMMSARHFQPIRVK